MTAAEYVKQYHTIQVPEYKMKSGKMVASTLVHTPVNEYVNANLTNRLGYSPAERRKFRKAIWEFIGLHAEMADTPVYKVSNGFKILNSIVPLNYINEDMFLDAFVGKASPADIQAAIQVLSYWRGWRELEEGYPVPALPYLVEMFLGMDCNGFVGNYMQTKYKHLEFRLGPRTPEEDYFYNRHSIRDSAADLRADDIVLLNRTPDPKKKERSTDWKNGKQEMEAELVEQRFLIGHIMVISSVVSSSSDSAVAMISESASSKEVDGGPRTQTHTLKRIGTYRWKIVGKAREVHSIIRVKRSG